jgi:hypothetical protein
VPGRPTTGSDGGMADKLRAAVDRTLSLAGRSARDSAALTRERATQLLDEVAQRGRDAQRRLSAIEDAVRGKSKPKAKD